MSQIPLAGRALLRTASFATLLVTLAACATTRPTGPGGPSAGPDETPATYPAYETFDASPYDVPPPGRVEVVHDVPAVVMAGRVVVPSGAGTPARTEPVARQVEGYRIQVFSSASRASAEQTRAAAASWWERAQRRAGAPGQLDASVVYLQPYYRVRLGGFATDAAADAALEFVRTEYPEAFLVPDVVTVVE